MGLQRVAVALMALLLGAGPAVADESVLNKEGFWLVGRGDAESTSCMVSTNAEDGTMLLFQVQPGHYDVVVGKPGPMRRAKAGVLIIDAARFAFAPDYTDDRKFFFFEDPGAKALAAVRSAQQVTVEVDGRVLLNIPVANTGLEGALDAALACAEGKSGWWGKGVVAKASKPAAEPPMVAHKDGVWGIVTEGATCLAQAQAPDAHFLQLLSVSGRIGLAVGADTPMPRGRKVRAETDSYSFEFKPDYDKDARYMASADLLDSGDAFALRRAKSLRLTADGRDIVDVDLGEGTFAEIVDAVTACSRGETGWWGEGAKPAS